MHRIEIYKPKTAIRANALFLNNNTFVSVPTVSSEMVVKFYFSKTVRLYKYKASKKLKLYNGNWNVLIVNAKTSKL